MVKNAKTKHITNQPKTVDEVVRDLQCDLTEGERRFIKWVLPKAKNAVSRREEGKVNQILTTSNFLLI